MFTSQQLYSKWQTSLQLYYSFTTAVCTSVRLLRRQARGSPTAVTSAVFNDVLVALQKKKIQFILAGLPHIHTNTFIYFIYVYIEYIYILYMCTHRIHIHSIYVYILCKHIQEKLTQRALLLLRATSMPTLLLLYEPFQVYYSLLLLYYCFMILRSQQEKLSLTAHWRSFEPLSRRCTAATALLQVYYSFSLA